VSWEGGVREPDKKCARAVGAKDVSESKLVGNAAVFCDWKGTLSDYLEKHCNKECLFGEVKCPLGCNKLVRVGELESHKHNDCTHRTVTCSLCKEGIKQVFSRLMKRVNVQKQWLLVVTVVEKCFVSFLGLVPISLQLTTFLTIQMPVGSPQVKTILGTTESARFFSEMRLLLSRLLYTGQKRGLVGAPRRVWTPTRAFGVEQNPAPGRREGMAYKRNILEDSK